MARPRKTNCWYKQGVADSNRRRSEHYGAVGKREGKQDPLYALWGAIKQRCFNPNHKAYHRYGGRGVTMCDEWRNSFPAFRGYASRGYATGLCLDRIDTDGNYEPNNVRWSSRKGQANNRATNVVLTHDGLTMTLKQWSEHRGEKYGLLASRWKKGLRGDELFAPPIYKRK